MEFTHLIEQARRHVGVMPLGVKHADAASVACALQTTAGDVFTGVCLDLPCGIGFCAEHAAVAEMVKSRQTKIDLIVAVNKDRVLTPCGRCRELLFQIDPDNVRTQVVVAFDESIELGELLPLHWMEGLPVR